MNEYQLKVILKNLKKPFLDFEKSNFSEIRWNELLIKIINRILHIRNWCYNSKKEFVLVNILKWKTDPDVIKPEKMEIKLSFIEEKNKIEYTDIYKYIRLLAKGGYGQIYTYESSDKKRIALKLIESKHKSYVEHEIKITNTLYNASCNIVDTYIIKQDIVDPNIKKVINNDNGVYSYNSINGKVFYTMILMPEAKGDYSNLIFDKYGIFLEKKDKISYKKIKTDLDFFKVILLQLKCLVEKYNLYYCDLKMAQVLVYSCGSNKNNYILGDLGGIFKADQKGAAVSFGPLQYPYGGSYGMYYNQDILLFTISAFFNNLFVNPINKKPLKLYYLNLEKSGEFPYNNKDQIVYGPSKEFIENCNLYFSDPADYLDMNSGNEGVVTSLKQNLNEIRILLIEWLSKDIKNRSSDIPVYKQNDILIEINKLLRLIK
jgi:hypothetical protein